VAWLHHHVVAWFLPVVNDGVTLPERLPGWQAFRVAATSVRPYQDVRYDSWSEAALATGSAETNLLMIGLMWLTSRSSSRLHGVGAGAALTAFIVNAHWLEFGGDWRSTRKILPLVVVFPGSSRFRVGSFWA
jgi:hypothetical protein